MFNGGPGFPIRADVGPMAKLNRGTFHLAYEDSGGSGEPVVLVHGLWGDHHQWDNVKTRLSGAYRVITYDRRGHGASTLSKETLGLADHTSDLTELISLVGRGPVHLVANDSGGTIALDLARLRPDEVRSVNLHEPSLVGLLESEPMAAMSRNGFTELESTVAGRIQARDATTAAQTYANGVSAEAGGWAQIPPEVQRTFVANAAAALKELEDPAMRQMELTPFATYREPIVLTGGSRSAPVFASINDHVAGAFYHALRYSFDGAGHFPHVTHAESFAHVATEFCQFASRQNPR
jgi:pimeloyl-ACP methyl ester carboxylesterase